MAEIRINATGGVKLYDADDSHYAQIVAGTITSNVDAITLGHDTVTIADNLSLGSDSSVLKFGADGDTTLTHTDGTGLTLNSTNKICFNDASQFIQGSSATVLSIGATDEIDLTATAVDLNGTLNVSGVATFQANPVFPDGGVAVADLDIDGATDIGAAIVDADLFIIDDGAGGTNRKVTASRIKTYAGGAVTAINNATANELVTIGATTTELDAEAGLTWDGSAMNVRGDPTTTNDQVYNLRLANDTDSATSGDAKTGIAFEVAYSGTTTTEIAGISAHKSNTSNSDYDGTLLFNTRKQGASIVSHMQIDEDGKVELLTGDLTLVDDKGITWGSGGDWHMGAGAGESILHINTGTDTDTAQGWDLEGASASTATVMSVISGETKGSGIRIVQDQNDDAADQWIFGQYATDGAHNTNLYWTQYSGGSWDNEMLLEQAGHLTTEGSMTASSTVDYAEFFEWKTELANDTAVTNSYGLTVVLDNDKVRLAESGEEADVLGAVRPNNTSAMVGGTQTFQWKDRYLTDVWGKAIMEEYTLVDWDETITELYTESDKIPEGKNVGDVRRTYLKHHKYPKDRIPAKKLKPEIQLNKSEHDWHTLADNLTADDLVVPTTDEEKTAANYTERTTYKKDKGDHKKGDKLMRKKINPSYVSSQAYLSRTKRRKEWCIVGLLGHVPIRDTAIVPTHWKKMKNLESGIDLYYIK